MILAVIVACEVGFWVAVVGGLAVRYLLRAPRAGAVVLLCAPLLDLVLLVATALHLRSGAEATWHHGLAALYIGFSVAYGHRLVRWADVRFAHRFAGGAAPERLTGRAYTVKCWADVARTLLGCAVAVSVLGAMLLVAGWSERTQPLLDTVPLLGVVLAADLLWAVSYTIWPRRSAEPRPAVRV